MFTVYLCLFLLVAGGYLIFVVDESYQDFASFFGIICWIFAIFFGSYILTKHTKQLSDFTMVAETQKKIELFQSRRDNLSNIIRVELAKYPEYEKEIIGKINPEILLNFPELKGSQTIIKTVDEIVKLEDSVYQLNADLLGLQQEIYYREISPWTLWVIPYKKFFGEENPVSVVRK